MVTVVGKFVNFNELGANNSMTFTADILKAFELINIFDNGRLSDKLCNKRSFRIKINLGRISYLFNSALVGYNNFVGNFYGFVLIVSDKYACDS